MARQFISSGSAFEEQIGYSRAVVDGDWIFVSGCTGYDYNTGSISSDVAQQANQAMSNVVSALNQAGSGAHDIVRIRYILPNAKDFPACWPSLKKWLGDTRPAATMIQAGLMNEDMKFEVEVTAKRSTGRSGSGGPPP